MYEITLENLYIICYREPSNQVLFIVYKFLFGRFL